jgi:DNA-binding XRE family transcriptional regulator
VLDIFVAIVCLIFVSKCAINRKLGITKQIYCLGGTLQDSHSVRRRRQDLGLSVNEVARMSGISADTIYRIERSTTNPCKVNVETALSLAKALEAPLYSLFRDEELSGLGRTPKTGVKIGRNVYHRVNAVCTQCNLEIPLAYTTTCPDCTPQRESAAVTI